MKGITSTIVVASLLLVACSAATTTTNGSTARETGQETPASEFAKAVIRAQDKAAESELRNATAASKVFFTAGATYTGLDPASGAEIEPFLTWVENEPAAVGTISIDLADHGVFVLSTMSESGHLFCVGNDESSGDTFGTVDGYGATSAADCTGGPWPP